MDDGVARKRYASDSPRAQRLRRFRQERERYIRNCAFTGEGMASTVRQLTAHKILEWLDHGRPWLMLTYTFPEQFGSDERRRFAVRDMTGRWIGKRGGKVVLGYERHRSGKLHAHALAEDPGIRRLSMMDAWTVETGGYMRCAVVQSREDAAAYVAKYIVKGEQGELEFLDAVSAAGLCDGAMGGAASGRE